MEGRYDVRFGPFRLDPAPGRLWRGAEPIVLRPRALAVLRYLAAHPGRLVPKVELLHQVWGGVHVTNTALRVCIRDIRAALGDTAAAPQYLETVGQEGYRFVGGADQCPPTAATPGPIVGRQQEVATLQRLYAQAAGGDRQLVLLSGEAGIGKTTVVDLWLAQRAGWGGVHLGWGQCVEHYGEAEPYLSVLEALGQLGQAPGGEQLVGVLRRQAPLWLVQLPALVTEAELEQLQRRLLGTTPTRMLRELADALAVYTAETPLVVVLEDLHWSDMATVELLAYLAQRREPARVFLLGTYRPVEAVMRAHPLRGLIQELRARGRCREIALELLTAVEVAAYVAGCLGGAVAPELAERVYRHTEGNALFVVNVVEDLVQRDLLTWVDGQWRLREDSAAGFPLPERLRPLVLRRVEGLPEATQRVLEATAVMGQQFAVAAVAAAVQRPVEAVEAVCEGLATHGELVAPEGLVRWPDGTVSGGYRFQHALYHEILYERVGEARRLRLHARLAARLEAGYGVKEGEIAAQLAVHFERGGETSRAIHYWWEASENAARRNAYPNAIAALRKGLALLATLPKSPEQVQRELALQLTLGEWLRTTMGLGARDVGEVYTRAYTLCQQTGEAPQLARVLWGLSQFHLTQGRLALADEWAQQLLDLVQRQPDTGYLVEGHFVMGTVASYRGELLAACGHLEQSWRLSDTVPFPPATLRGGFVPGVTPRTSLARVLWALGYVDQARQRCQEALVLARQGDHPPTLAYAECFAGLVCQCCRDVAGTQAHADALLALASANNWPLRAAQGRILRGWTLAMQGEDSAGVALLSQGLASPDVGPEILRPHWLALLAEAYVEAGQPEAGLTVLDEAFTLVATTEVRWWEAELSRLKGMLLLQLPRPEASQAEGYFQQAIEVARRQQAKSIELRATVSLSRLWQRQGKREEARQLLAPIYGWFTEGFDTTDLREAKMVLDALS